MYPGPWKADASTACTTRIGHASCSKPPAAAPSEPVVLYDIADDGSAAIDYLVNQWQNELGIETEVRSFEFAQFLDETASGVAQGPFELGWVWDYPSPYSIISPLFESNSGANNLDFADDAFDALMAQVRESADEATALPALEDAQAILADQLPMIPLGFSKDAGVMSDRITGAINDTGSIWRLDLVEVVG